MIRNGRVNDNSLVQGVHNGYASMQQLKYGYEKKESFSYQYNANYFFGQKNNDIS